MIRFSILSKSNFLLGLLLIVFANTARAEDGYRLWLRYDAIDDAALLEQYRSHCSMLISQGNSKTIDAAKSELLRGINGMLGINLGLAENLGPNGNILLGTPENSALIRSLDLPGLDQLESEGFTIFTKEIEGKKCLVITANSDIDVLYGTFHFLKLLQTHRDISDLAIKDAPQIKNRILNHWDNLDGSVERGYAGASR